MAIKFSCSNIMFECTAELVGETEEELLEETATHFAEHHDMAELDEETLEKVKAGLTPA